MRNGQGHCQIILKWGCLTRFAKEGKNYHIFQTCKQNEQLLNPKFV